MKVVKKNLFMAIVYSLIFVILCFAFSGNTVAASEDFENSSLGVTVIDEDNSTASKAFTDYIASQHKLVEIENSKDEILDAL